MKKTYLDNFYENVFKKEKEIFSLTVPLTLIHRHIFSQNSIILQKKYNLTPSEIDVLAALLFNNKIMSPTELYEATILSSGGMTKILKKLQEKKLIKRVASKQDKRSFLVQIEPKGESLVETSLDNLIELDKNVFSVLDEKEKEALKELLKKLVYSLD